MNKKNTNQTSKNNTKPLIAPNTIIKLTIPKKDALDAYNKSLRKLAKKIKVDGFRKGKVPAKIAEEYLNHQQIIENALQLLIPDLYAKEIKKSGKKPLTHPEFNPISLEKGEDWVLEAHIAQKPVINLKSYKTIVKKAKKQALKEIEKQKRKKDQKKPTKEEKDNFVLQFIYKSLVEELKPAIQELLVKQEVKYDLDNLSHRLKHMNIPFEKFLEHRKMTFEQLSSELAVGALGRLQLGFIIDEIVKAAKITVEKSDLEKEFSKITDKKLLKQQKNDPRYIDIMQQTILRQKVANHILEIS